MASELSRADQVQRFTFGCVAGEKHNDGQWVDYDDYAALRERMEQLESQLKQARLHEIGG